MIGNATAETFRARVDAALADDALRAAVAHATYRQAGARQAALAQLGDPETWRAQAKRIRDHTIEHLDYYLEQAAERIEARGGRVHWALDAADAVRAILTILENAGCRHVVKSKSMVTEEIGLNAHLEAAGIDVVETDLGEYILQLAGERPSHLIAPAIHKSREQIHRLFEERFDQTLPEDAAALTAFARKVLREKFLNADAGITGANFVVAESGTITLVTNEGNGRLVTSLPRVHIAVVGIERIVPTFEHLSVLLELLARSGTGQKLTVYTSLVGGTRRDGEFDGPEEQHVIFVDNGRSNLLGTRFQTGLDCIRCGACLNVCPVYRQIGGHAYGGVYNGPIGAVISPLLDEPASWQQLPQASSLCGACHDACPVMIPLHDLLVDLRTETKMHAPDAPASRWFYRIWRYVFTNPGAYLRLVRIARRLLDDRYEPGPYLQGLGPLAGWLKTRDLPPLASQTFRERWQAMQKDGDRHGV